MMTTTRTRRQASTLRKGRTYSHLGAHYGHGGLTYTGRTAGHPTFRCQGCGDTVFLGIDTDGTIDLEA